MSETPALAADFQDVVARWNPSGLAHVRATRSSSIIVVGQLDSGICEELDRVAPALEYTRSAAEAALALLVVDASGPIGMSELDLIRDICERIPVLVAMTRIDGYRNWQRIADRNAALLDEHLPHSLDVSVWPVSVRWSARTTGRADDALADKSGVDALSRRLHSMVSRAGAGNDHVRYRAAVVNAASQARRAVVDRARNPDDARHVNRLRTERAAVATTRDSTRTDRAAVLRSRIAQAKVDVVHAVGDELRQVSAAARTAVDVMDKAELTQFANRLAGLVDAAADRIEGVVRMRIAAIYAEVVGEAASGEAARAAPDRLASLPPPIARRRRGTEDRVMILVGASAGVSAGRLAVSPLAMVPALDIASIPLTFLLGGVFAWWITRARGVAAQRNQLRSWVNDTAVHAKSALEQRVLAQIFEAENRIGGVLDAAAHASNAVRDQTLARIDGELRGLADTRSRFMASCDQDLMILDRGLEFVNRREPADAPARPTQ